MPSRAHRRAVAALVLALPLVAVAACTGDPEPGTEVRLGPPLSWTKVGLPAGDQPVLLSGTGDSLLIGLRHPGARVVPRLMVRAPSGQLSAVPLQPGSPYAYEASWHSITSDGRRILAVGGAPGGAHANTRWTVWSGTAAGLAEQPQSFNTFGGWGAGSVLDAVITPAGAALVGSWGSDRAGLDAAVWLPTGDRWVRQPAAGTALESTGELLVGPRFGAAAGSDVVVAGAQVHLGPGVVRQRAAIWRSRTPAGGWTRTELPDPGDRSEAVTARCTATACTVTGYADGKLAMWRIDGDHASRLTGLPPVAVTDRDALPSPIDLDGRLVQVVAEAGRIRVLIGDGTGWTAHESTGPAGAVTDAALAGESLYLIAGPAGGPGTLWRTDITSLG